MDEGDDATVVSTVHEESEKGEDSMSKDHDKVIAHIPYLPGGVEVLNPLAIKHHRHVP